MPDYSKGKIYKIINTQNEIIYIGSTIQKLSCRFCKHTHKGGGNKIILIENFSCNSKEELVQKEQDYIDQYNNLLNKQRAYNSKEYNKNCKLKYDKKYRINNKEKIKEQNKEYRIKNLDKLKERKKEYINNNKEKEKERHNIWYENNKQTEREKGKLYYQNNKEKLKEINKEYYQKNKVKVKCDLCNAEITKQGLSDHKKTQKCINNRLICD